MGPYKIIGILLGLASAMVVLAIFSPAIAADNYPVSRGLAIQRGLIQGASKFIGFGEVDVGGAENNVDVWIADNIQPEPDTVGYQPTVISSSTDDGSPSGMGVRTIRVLYLDTNGVAQSEDVTLNGQTEVTMTATNVMFVQMLFSLTAGINMVAAGDIDVRNVADTVVNRIGVSGNHSLSTMRQVPAGKVLYITGFHASSVAAGVGKRAIVRLRTTSHGGIVGAAGIYIFRHTVILINSTSGWIPFDPPLKIPALSTVKISVWTTGATLVNGAWIGWIENE